jgi:hypothetical protein
MYCHFCQNSLQENKHPGDPDGKFFILYLCRNCIPEHKTLFREVYDSTTFQLLADATRVDEFYIIRNYKENKTIINKDIIGVIESSTDLEPITYTKPVCELDGIFDIPFRNLELLRHKLSIYTTFS